MYNEEYVGEEEIIGASDEQVLSEFVSGEEIVGYVDDETGAVLRAPRLRAPQRRAKQLPGRRYALVNEGPRNARRFPLGIPQTNVGAGATVDIQLLPQRKFRIDALVVPSWVAPDFDIVDILIGQDSQLVAAGAIPADAFVENSTSGDNLQCNTASPGTTIVVRVRNRNLAARDFRGSFFGVALT